MTQEEATKPQNEDDVRLNLELNRKTQRKYPPVKRGDRVRIYWKKQPGNKENVPYWSENTCAVESVTCDFGKKDKGNPIKLYKVNKKRAMKCDEQDRLLRRETFKVPEAEKPKTKKKT